MKRSYLPWTYILPAKGAHLCLRYWLDTMVALESTFTLRKAAVDMHVKQLGNTMLQLYPSWLGIHYKNPQQSTVTHLYFLAKKGNRKEMCLVSQEHNTNYLKHTI